MILRRIASALQRQDWITVAIEFALVVIGVLVALQVDTWAQHRADQRDYEAALDRLIAEIDENLKILDIVDEEHAEDIRGVRGALDALETCVDDDQTQDAVNRGLAYLTGTSGLALRDGALTELTSTPRLLARQSDAIRARLADVLFYLEIAEKEARFYEIFPLENRPERNDILRHGPWKAREVTYLGINYSGERRALMLAVPVSVACKNSSLLADLMAWIRWQSNLSILTRKMREEYRLTLDLLAEELR